MEYRVVPFVASIEQNKGTSNDAAEQLEKLINQAKKEGWNYVRLESVTTYVQPISGCFSIGGSPGYTTSKQMLVFQRT